MLVLGIVCFWHAIQTLLPLERYPLKDYYAFAVCGGCYTVYNLQFMIRILVVVSISTRWCSKHEAKDERVFVKGI